MRDQSSIETELMFEREIERSRILSIFRRNPSTWELLLKLASEPNNTGDGLYETIAQVQTRYLGHSALLKFVRDRRDDGLLHFSEHTKRSKWRVSLDPGLREELVSVLAWRSEHLLRNLHNRETGPEKIIGVDRWAELQGNGQDARE